MESRVSTEDFLRILLASLCDFGRNRRPRAHTGDTRKSLCSHVHLQIKLSILQSVNMWRKCMPVFFPIQSSSIVVEKPLRKRYSCNHKSPCQIPSNAIAEDQPHICIPPKENLRCRVVPHNSLDLDLILCSILLEEVVCVSLRWRVWVGIIKKILDAEKNLLDRDRGLPTLFFVQDG